MDIVVVTGAGGLVGAETVRHYAATADLVVGVDNDLRAHFFGPDASTAWNVAALRRDHPDTYRHVAADIRDRGAVETVFAEYGTDISLVVHAAAQPSHDWAAREPLTDFEVNATATLVLLEATRRHCPEAVFIFTSTNKVYGDRPNGLPLVEQDERWEIDPAHPYAQGIDESMSIDASTHSLFGVSKAAADLLVQEYGRYFGLRTAAFRGGCLTGPGHSGAQLHGFLAYLMKCTVTGEPYTVFGYKGKQVRDNIHSADLVAAFDAFRDAPRVGEAYNIGGGRFANCSMLEAIALCEEIAGRSLSWDYVPEHRIGDHMWWISDYGKFQRHFPTWQPRYDIPGTLESIYAEGTQRWGVGVGSPRAKPPYGP